MIGSSVERHVRQTVPPVPPLPAMPPIPPRPAFRPCRYRLFRLSPPVVPAVPPVPPRPPVVPPYHRTCRRSRTCRRFPRGRLSCPPSPTRTCRPSRRAADSASAARARPDRRPLRPGPIRRPSPSRRYHPIRFRERHRGRFRPRHRGAATTARIGPCVHGERSAPTRSSQQESPSIPRPDRRPIVHCLDLAVADGTWIHPLSGATATNRLAQSIAPPHRAGRRDGRDRRHGTARPGDGRASR